MRCISFCVIAVSQESLHFTFLTWLWIYSHRSNTFTLNRGLRVVVPKIMAIGIVVIQTELMSFKILCLSSIDSEPDIVCYRADQLHSKPGPDDTTCQLNPAPSHHHSLWTRGWPTSRPDDRRQALRWPNCAGCRLYLWRHQGRTWKMTERTTFWYGCHSRECVIMTNRLSDITKWYLTIDLSWLPKHWNMISLAIWVTLTYPDI